MRKIIIFISLIFLTSPEAKADSIDYWNVYLNDIEIARFNITSENPVIELKRQDLGSGDLISVRYVSDVLHVNRWYALVVMPKAQSMMFSNESLQSNDLLYISVSSLLKCQKSDEPGVFSVWHFEKERDSVVKQQELFQLIIR